MKKLLMAINILCASAATDAQISSSQDLRDSLAPTGKLRASLYLGGPTNVIVHPKTGEMKGVGYEIGKELARRLDIPFEPVIYRLGIPRPKGRIFHGGPLHLLTGS